MGGYICIGIFVILIFTIILSASAWDSHLKDNPEQH